VRRPPSKRQQSASRQEAARHSVSGLELWRGERESRAGQTPARIRTCRWQRTSGSCR
jgi:hypothetical protein